MAEKQYIERDAVLKHQRKMRGCGLSPEDDYWDYAVLAEDIESTPAADVAPVVHGEWIDRDDKTWCSRCDASNKQYKPPYCPHCGARMDGGKHGQA